MSNTIITVELKNIVPRSRPDLKEDFLGLGIKIGDEHFDNPSFENIRNIYESLLVAFTGYHHLSGQQEDMQNPFEVEKAQRFQTAKLLKRIILMFRSLGLVKFSLMDLLTTPDKKTFCKWMTLCMDYNAYADAQLGALAEKNESYHTAFERNSELKQKKEEQEVLLAQLQRRKDEEAPIIAETEAQFNEYRIEAEMLNRNIIELAEQRKKLKEEYLKLQDTYNKQQIEIQTLETKKKNLEMKVAPSPERLQERIIELTEEMEKSRQIQKEGNDEAIALQENIKELHRSMKTLKEIDTEMENALVEKGICKQYRKETKGAQRRRNELGNESKKLESEINLKQQQFNSLEQDLKRLEQQYNEKVQSLNEEISLIQNKLSQLVERKVAVNGVKEEISVLEKEFQEKEESHSREIAQAREAQSRLIEALRRLKERIYAAFQTPGVP
ncbi:putative kinetochore protein Nuf2 [Blattamonas nauphoetae]|uniref:Kinetochore protein Nuf2 n=1 Tax=Blattamonas nauphoetae TaxID=2049346 RepID=A0ABQ9Y4E2_9EUKA|nr:putative kinetochore protein Nuf2 [Blattamonas nauphoetae]